MLLKLRKLYQKHLKQGFVAEHTAALILFQMLVAFSLVMDTVMREGKRAIHTPSISAENQWELHSALGGVVSE